MSTIKTSTLAIHFEDVGSGDVVLLIHGWPDTARGWLNVRQGLVSDGYRVVVPDLRGCGQTTFLDLTTVRDGSAAALSRDILDLADSLDVERFAVIGHDWGARVAYALAAVAPGRITSIAALGLAYQPGGRFVMPDFRQARRFWYQWLMYLDAGVEAITADPIGFARVQWETWSPAGWFSPEEFAATATGFENPDWVPITLNAYRSRFLRDESLDNRYDPLRSQIASTQRIATPTLMIQGAADNCDPPATSEGLAPYFDSYERVLIDGVGHFPHREAPEQVLHHLRAHLATNP